MNTKALLYLVLLVFLVGCKQNQEKKLYPEFVLSDLQGKKIIITKFKNRLQIKNQSKPLLLFFVQPSCTQCFKGIEHIGRIYQDYKDQITFITILSDPQSQGENFASEVEALRENYGLEFDFYHCVGENLFESYERETDTNFIALYDDKLRLVAEYEGIIPEEMVELDLNQILNKMEKNDVSNP